LNSFHHRQVLLKYLPGGFAGYDREGAPVRVEAYGHLDVKGILYSVKKVDIEKTKMLLGEQVMKKLKAQSAKVRLCEFVVGRCSYVVSTRNCIQKHTFYVIKIY